MKRWSLVALTVGGLLVLPAATSAQDKAYPLETRDGLTVHNVAAEPVTHEGRKGLRVMISKDALGRMEAMTPEQRAGLEQLAVIDGSDFSSGVIEAEIAGAPAPGAAEGARGFVGIAFRVQKDLRTYDAFYLRPTNGRAEDQERRNHAAQYIAHPRVALVPAPQGDPEPVRVVRGSRAGGLDEGQDRGATAARRGSTSTTRNSRR